MRVYLDNAASTPLDQEVLDAMMPYMLEHYGNPSSIHTHGREARTAIEKSRKAVASLLSTSPSEIFFTSGGTEADNTAIHCHINSYGIRHVISSPIEHHAVLHCLEDLEHSGIVKVSYLQHDDTGNFNMAELDNLLQKNPGSMVSLMHANNELGNINDIEEIGRLCSVHHAIFHSDTVQTIGHLPLDLQKLKINYIVGSAHKFHGPKGAGFLYANSSHKISPLIFGGAQERNMRGGTENIYGIVGLAKAMEIAYRDIEKDRKYIQGLKDSMIRKLKESVADISFNGESENNQKSLYTILNVSLPASEDNDMLLFNLDINSISVSAGSACASGTDVGSHVLRSINASPERGHVRLSFSKYNTMEEVDYVAEKVAALYRK
ncbi:MAG TPA: cysteine desulfurase family protein [Cytophagaceae bacterium]|jgi:cysteine desulfurase|nr:cysteine desulfurase family protein [Cytophagaceae bacterium]